MVACLPPELFAPGGTLGLPDGEEQVDNEQAIPMTSAQRMMDMAESYKRVRVSRRKWRQQLRR
jgi:hypothetical protein